MFLNLELLIFLVSNYYVYNIDLNIIRDNYVIYPFLQAIQYKVNDCCYNAGLTFLLVYF